MEFKEIMGKIKEGCGEDIARVVLNNAQKLKEADTDIDAGLAEIKALKAEIEEMKSIKVENTRLKKNKVDYEKKFKEVDDRENAVKHDEDMNALKISNAEKSVEDLFKLARILSGKETKSGSTGRKTKSNDEQK